tara:strand:+ start:162 stop:401 length:240 start_codon:yes stop_codon:yes gene_type:complete
MGAGCMDTVEDMEISFNHPRLKRCFKTLIWFSEIFPKKYQNEFIDTILSKRHGMCKDRSKPMTPKYKSEVIDAMTEKQQ